MAETDSPAEDELRVLLEQAVPKLPAPEGRIERVRERAVRHRRRRRTAGAAAAAVTLLALGGTLMPHTLRGGSGDNRPVLPAAPAPSAREQESVVRYPELAALTLRLPPGWGALAVPADPGRKVAARGFAGTQPLAYEQPCPERDPSDCVPVEALRPGGVLLTLTLEPGDGLEPTQDLPVLFKLTDMSPSCRNIRGIKAYLALLNRVPAADTSGAPAADSVVRVHLCVAGNVSPRMLEDVQRMLARARFGDRGATSAPTPTPPRPPKAEFSK